MAEGNTATTAEAGQDGVDLPRPSAKKTVNLPPAMSVETSKHDDEDHPSEGERYFGQARTPKHANKTRDDDGGAPGAQPKITPDRFERHEDGRPPYSGGGAQPGGYPGGFATSRSFEGRPIGGGAFQPHESRRHPPPPGGPHGGEYYPPPPRPQGMHTVSPRGAHGAHHRYYAGPPPPRQPRMDPGFQHHGGGYYEQRSYNDYGPPPGRAAYEGGPPPGYRGSYNPSVPPPQNYASYPPESRGYASGPPPPGVYHAGGPPSFPPHTAPVEHYSRAEGRYPVEHHPSTSGTFSRAVSSSFDRSIRSRVEEKPMGPVSVPPGKPPKPSDASMASDDSSWRQLKQVHSVDDSAIRERLKKDQEEAEKHIQVAEEPASTSSSLTNSPTEGPERLHAAKEAQRLVVAAAAAVESKQPSSLDSLSSVASAQAPIDTPSSKKQAKAASQLASAGPPPPSPGADSASLDLMKCHSGSSGLLHLPPQQRNEELVEDGKRGREERGDVDTGATVDTGDDEIRRAPSEYDDSKHGTEAPPSKKARVDDGSKHTKSSPLSITCSPSADKLKESTSRMKAPSSKSDYTSPQPMEGSFYDKPPTYSYSMDSAPSLPRDGGLALRKQPSYPSLPPRPGSSSSSTITPAGMQVDDARVPSVPSWEIHPQDSFGNGSIGGGQGLTSSFSFQDYPMIPPTESDSASHGHPPVAPPPIHAPPPPHHQVAPNHPQLESRNQSFEGGHYHGSTSFHRNDSMDISYSGRPAVSYGVSQGHQGQFPPHAPSWGTAGSSSSHHSAYHPPGHYSSYGGRMPHDYTVMRNYSHDSAHRTSPPVGPGMSMRRGPPAGFQPPSEFVAPHNPQLTRRPPPAVYIMPTSQSPGSKRGSGVFSWSKDDDNHLTDIMKKHKNPRDWEPIAKELGRGKTAKECHERWIRYLKPGVRKGQWTDQEDAIVIEAVTTSNEQPFTRWSDLAQQLPGRVGKQIRDRWVNHLNPNINHLPFSREDDLNLWNGHEKLGKRWVEISTKFFKSSRSENHIKNRWYSASFKKFITNEFGAEAYAGTSKPMKKDKKKKSSAMKDDEDATMAAI